MAYNKGQPRDKAGKWSSGGGGGGGGGGAVRTISDKELAAKALANRKESDALADNLGKNHSSMSKKELKKAEEKLSTIDDRGAKFQKEYQRRADIERVILADSFGAKSPFGENSKKTAELRADIKNESAKGGRLDRPRKLPDGQQRSRANLALDKGRRAAVTRKRTSTSRSNVD